MFRRFSVNFALFSIGLDVLLITGSLYLASLFRPFLSKYPFIQSYPQSLNINWIIYPVFAIVWVSIFLLTALYDGRKNFKLVDELTSLSLGSILAAVSLAGVLYLSFRDVSRALFLVFILMAYLLMVFWRLIARVGFRLTYNNPVSQRKVLIVGAGPVGRKVEEQIKINSGLGLHLVGFLDDNPAKREEKRDVIGLVTDIQAIVIKEDINDVVIALPQRAHRKINHLIAQLHSMPVKVWVIPDYFHLALHKAVVEEFAGIPMLDMRAPALNDYQRMLKRTLDMGIALILFIPGAILFSLIALLIFLEDRGPILFRQVRVGENGRLFKMFKFRTMVPGAEELRHLVETVDEQGNLIHKTAKDPRVTRIGHLLRKTSLDEIPQIFNVMRGDMSIVGPRPELPYLVDHYEPWQRRRFAVPQGITGWWQVNGRSDKLMHLHTEDDIYYVQNYSLGLDIKILIKTVIVVLRGKGAY